MATVRIQLDLTPPHPRTSNSQRERDGSRPDADFKGGPAAHDRPDRLVEARSLLPDLSAQLPRLQRRWDRRSRGDRGQARLYRRAWRGCDLALAGVHLADAGLRL